MQTDTPRSALLRAYALTAAQARVLICTLGGIESFVRGAPALWKGHSLGEPQLRNMLSYLLARAGFPVHRDDIAGVGSKAPARLARSTNLASGLLHMLRGWGMGPALSQGRHTITLNRDPCWALDTDLLRDALGMAARHYEAGDVDAELVTLQGVAGLCGGVYLDRFEVPDHVAECDLEAKRLRWERRQRDLLHRLIELQLRRLDYAGASDSAYLLEQLDTDNQADYRQIAAFNLACGAYKLAQYYYDKAETAASLDETNWPSL